jgi:hypothetical protein
VLSALLLQLLYRLKQTSIGKALVRILYKEQARKESEGSVDAGWI